MRVDRVDLSGGNVNRSHRSLDERIFVRFPAVAHRLTALWSRLPPGSWLRRRVLIHFGVMLAAAANRRDWDVLLVGLDPAVEYRVVSAGPGRDVAPDMVGTHHGHDGYVQGWQTMLEGFGDMRMELTEVLDRGDRLMSVTRVMAHGPASGAPIEQLMYQVFTLRRGLVIDQVDYWDRDDALAALEA